MSRSITQTSSSSSAVAAGSSVIAPVFTTTGFNAGDYIYTTPTGIGTRVTGNVFVGADTPYVGTSFINTGIQSNNFRSASYGPYIDQATYVGATRALGGVIVAQSTVLSTASNNSRSCTLANGNIVQMYSQGSNLYFRIIDTAGSVVVAQITLSTILQSSTNVGNFACCTLVSGDIQFIFNEGTAYSCTTVQYSSTGSVVVAATARGISTSQYGNLSMAALSGGGSVVCGSSGYTSTIGNPALIRLASNGSISGDFAGTSASPGSCNYMQVVGLPASFGTNIYAYYSQDTNTATGYYATLTVYSGNSFVTTLQNTYSSMNSANGGVFNMTFTTDGYIVAVSYFGGPYYFKALYTKTTNTSGTLASIANGSIGSGNGATLAALPDGGVSCVAVTNSGNVFVNTAPSSMSFNSQVQVGSTITTTTAHLGKLSSTTSNGVAVINYLAAGTSYNSSIVTATIPATNGVTTLTGATNYLPSVGYYLMGVAATNASANTTGQVIMNGTAQLGSTYPTVTTPIYYSYQTTASQPIFGQRGSVSATTVTLKGLEA